VCISSGQKFPQAGQTVVVHYTGICGTVKVDFVMCSSSLPVVDYDSLYKFSPLSSVENTSCLFSIKI